jgi:hypothetical protein
MSVINESVITHAVEAAERLRFHHRLVVGSSINPRVCAVEIGDVDTGVVFTSGADEAARSVHFRYQPRREIACAQPHHPQDITDIGLGAESKMNGIYKMFS